MGDPRGFLKLGRRPLRERSVDERTKNWQEFAPALQPDELRAEASRCMDCGVPFCHQGCPLGNLIPEWNDLAYTGEIERARARLLATNNFPEITGRVCPAPCEASCVLNIEEQPVHIKAIEKTLAYDDAVFAPAPRPASTGARVAVVGSGPAGLACAQQLARMGHDVTVLEKDARPGGLLRYGIPDFKLEKEVVERRVAQMEAEGVHFACGRAPAASELLDASAFDAVVLACGARVPRDLPVPGRELSGVHFAMEFLTQQNQRVGGEEVTGAPILATGKRVIVVGGGDTGSDCVGTSRRQGAASIAQIELLARPPDARSAENPWPEWPMILRTSSSHEEGCERQFAVRTKALVGSDGHVTALRAERVDDGTPIEVAADLVLLAMGFTGPENDLPSALGAARDARGNVVTTPDGATSVPRVFAAGDMVRGQSLVVWAIADGRRVAAGVDRWLRARGAASDAWPLKLAASG